MRKMKDSGIEWIGEIPEDWEVLPISTTLNEVCTLNENGYVKNALQFKYGTIITKDNFNSDEDDYIATIIKKYTIVKTSDIIINGLNLNFDFISQRVGIVQNDGVITSAYLALRIKDTEKVLPTYIIYLFKSYDICKAFHNMGGGVRKILNYSILKKHNVILPSPVQQNRIAAYLDAKTAVIDEAISKQRVLIDKLVAYKQSLITETVTKGLNPDVPMKDSGVEWMGEIPEHWDLLKLKQISTLISKGTTPSTINREILSEGEIRFLKAENIQNNQITLKPSFYIDMKTNEMLRRSQLLENDIVFVIAGATIGKVAIIQQSSLPANTNQAVAFVRLLSRENIKFIWYCLQSNYIKTELKLLSVQAAQPNLSLEELGHFLIPYPLNRIEQQQIAEYLDTKCAAIDANIAKRRTMIEKLTQYKKSLIYEAVTGKMEI